MNKQSHGIKDQVFCLRGDENHPLWYCTVGGKTHGPWPDKGTALAGLRTEQVRAAARVERLSRLAAVADV